MEAYNTIPIPESRMEGRILGVNDAPAHGLKVGDLSFTATNSVDGKRTDIVDPCQSDVLHISKSIYDADVHVTPRYHPNRTSMVSCFRLFTSPRAYGRSNVSWK